MQRDRWPLFLLVALLLPACFIGVGNSHDWGDDFAQYLAQARDLSEGERLDVQASVRNWEGYGPAPKGIGYSMLLAPVWAAAGNQVQPYVVLNGLVFMALCLLMYYYLQPDHGPWPALLGTLLFGYDRHVLVAKSTIMPDLLLVLLVVATLVVLRKAGPRRYLFVALLVAFAIMVKSAGWVLYVVVGIAVLRSWRSTERKASLVQVLLVFFLPVALPLACTMVLSHQALGGVFWYGTVFAGHGFVQTLAETASAYAASLWHFFEQELPMWMNHVMVPVVLMLILAGVVVRVRRGADTGDRFTALWLVMLLCYPYTNATDRFLLPLLPFVIRYLLHGLRWLVMRVRLHETIPMIALLVLLILSHAVTVRDIARSGDRVIAGPYSPAASEAFEEVKRRSVAGQLIGTSRPWAVHLFTDRATVWLPSPDKPVLRSFHAPDPVPDFILLATSAAHKGMYDGSLLHGIIANPGWVPVWRNDSFTLVQRKKTQR